MERRREMGAISLVWDQITQTAPGAIETIEGADLGCIYSLPLGGQEIIRLKNINRTSFPRTTQLASLLLRPLWNIENHNQNHHEVLQRRSCCCSCCFRQCCRRSQHWSGFGHQPSWKALQSKYVSIIIMINLPRPILGVRNMRLTLHVILAGTGCNAATDCCNGACISTTANKFAKHCN